MLKFALVGCGHIANKHANILATAQVNGAKLTAVCDIIPERAKALSEKHQVKAYTDMHLMAESESPDVFVVLTESGYHARDVIELAKYGKHIVVEKPMALTLDDADKMIAACDKFGGKLFVVKQMRFHKPVVQTQRAVKEGLLGKLVLGTVRVRWCRPQDYYDKDDWRGTWALDGGVLTNQASHHIDLLEWLMGDVESVFAKSQTALVDIEAEDTAVVTLKFKNGALGIIEATTATRPKNLEGSVSLLGSEGSIEVGGFAADKLKTWNIAENSIIPADVNEFANNPEKDGEFGHRSYYEHVVDSILNEKQHLVDGLVGRKSLELINAIYESIETGKEVFLRFKPVRSKLGKLND